MSKLIVCDVQPMYEDFIHFNLNGFCSSLNNYNEVLVLYNGPETCESDSEYDIQSWYLKHGFDEDNICSLTFIDKGYAYLRGWMDNDIEDDLIITVLQVMIAADIWDSRDLDSLPKEVRYLSDNIGLPNFKPEILHRWDGSDIVGGGQFECLKEFQLFLEALQLTTVEKREFIY